MTTLAQFLAAGKTPDHLSGMNPAFTDALARMLADAPGGVTINSGYRSPERQAQLWQEALAKYGSPEAARKWVAPPGRSQHNHGSAADLGFASPEVEQWVHANAPRYGLNFRMGHEPWHIELGGSDGASGVGAGNGMVPSGAGAPGLPAGGPLPQPAPPSPLSLIAGLLAAQAAPGTPDQEARSLTPLDGLVSGQGPSLALALAELDKLGGRGLG